MVNVVLGFTEKDFNKSQLTSNYFPTKVGGKPVWLDLSNIPKREELFCEKCSKQMAFLMQIYAPIDENEDSFHRMVHIFCCKDPRCGYYAAVRTQLPQVNSFYPSDADERKYDENYEDLYKQQPEYTKNRQNTCDYCGCFAKSNCSGCKKVYYCSKEHQQLDWELGHSEQCKLLKDLNIIDINNLEENKKIPRKRVSDFLFKELDIITESLELKEFPPPTTTTTTTTTTDDKNTNTNGNSNTESINNLKIDSDDEYDDDNDEDDIDLDENGNPVYKNEIGKELIPTNGGETMTNDPEAIGKFEDYIGETGKKAEFNEETFTKIKDKSLIYFKRIVDNDQDQILRYSKDSNYPILWVSDTDQAPEPIPQCSNCGSNRKFEFQILPQLLYFLDMDSTLANNSFDIDFGILSIYTCESSCQIKSNTTTTTTSPSFVKEYIFKQDFKK
ncbi:hypothetical protein RB653_001272 [Dictyostelium firmibasis]|uniref:MYND-type domain-containing protein n=1 Tax=Dictyostelium firmibasis TaxID=79012 RepID=A0AAN7YWH9_9MYCE